MKKIVSFILLLMTVSISSYAFEYRIMSKSPVSELNGAELLLVNEIEWSTDSYGEIKNGVIDIKGESPRSFPAHLIITNKEKGNDKSIYSIVSLIVEPDTIIVDFKERFPLAGGKLNQEYKNIHERLSDVEYKTDLSKEVFKEYFYKNIGNGLGESVLMDYGLICSPDEWIEMVDHLDNETKSLPAIENMTERKECLKLSWEGMPFVELNGETLEGDSINLSNFVGKGKYVIADIWASWCKPCIKEAEENLKPFYEKFKDNHDVMVLGIAYDDVSNTVAKHGIVWPQIQKCDNQLMAKYGVYFFPEIILFGPDGPILRRFLKGTDIAPLMEEILRNGSVSEVYIGGECPE